ncbi:MAG: histidine kinase [Saprospiraceae bacterium]|jgi:sensor histidine kinase YesM|nr:histidine kinase [Saprospiraceae bacterium]
MKIQIKSIHKKILFHIFLWGTWFYLTLSNTSDDQFYTRFVFLSSLILLTHIPLFLLNTEWLIPTVLPKKGVNTYFWSLIVIIILFTILHGFVWVWVNDYLGVPFKKGYSYNRGMIALVLVAAISTGYGLLDDFVIREKNLAEKQKEKLQSELSFLRSQISPHFIFNILNSIVYLIRSNATLAESVTLKLSNLMRYMLYDSENAQISLDKEISYVENYIELQKIRFEEDVDIQYEKKGEATHQLIEPMLIIPFVENAFKHGVGMVENPTIKINVETTDNSFNFAVENKLSPEIASDKDESSGIGLKNVQRRLELLYPHNHKLDIKTEDGWFKVNLGLTL